MTPRPVLGIEHIGLQVPDLEAALALFVDALGFELRFRGLGPDDETPVAFVACGDTEFELFQRGTEGARLEHLALRVDGDVVAAGERLARAGVTATGGEVQGMRGTRALLLDQAATLGVRMHLSTEVPT
ncbi:MAG TPA: VOC family protein [Conexibacter sp.]